MDTLPIADSVRVGENDHWKFGVGRLEERWIGFAVGDCEDGTKFMHIFPEISAGPELGVGSREDAIRMVSALACDPEQSFGGIDEWFIDESLRASPDDFRCENCGTCGCPGDCGDCWDYPI